jgi:hypothetical protein
MKAFIGGMLMIVGLVVVSGSANDCDGRCMEQANDTATMLMVAGAGLFAMIVGFLVAKDEIRG